MSRRAIAFVLLGLAAASVIGLRLPLSGIAWIAGVVILSVLAVVLTRRTSLISPRVGAAVARAVDVGYLPLFWIQIALVATWLLLGAMPAVVAAFPELHDRLHEIGAGHGLLAEFAQNIALASHSASSWFQTTVDYLFSLLNLGLAIFLVRHDSKHMVARLLAVGMGSTAVAFNLQSHHALLVIPQTWFGAVELWHTIAIHTAAGIAYLFALLLFPDGRFVARRRLPYLFLITLAYGGVAALTAEDHIVGLVLLFGVLTPLAGLTSQAYRYRTATRDSLKQRSRLILVALSLALAAALVVGGLTIALSSTNEEFSETTKAYSFSAPAVGTYGFVCDPHANDMVGQVVVRPREPGDPTLFRTEIVAENGEFDRDRLVFPAGTEVVVQFTNKDGDGHNVAIYDGLFAAAPTEGEKPVFADDARPLFVGELFPGGDLADLLFRIFRAVFIVLPIALFVGIVKLRIWDIDRLMNRALVYALLTGLLGSVYLAGVFGLGGLAGAVTDEQRAPAVVAMSTLAVAALFRPARRSIQDFIDRRFYRQRYDAARTLDKFTIRMRDRIELDSLRTDLIEVVIRTMQPAHASLWLRPAENGAERPKPDDDTKTLSQSVS